MHDPLFDNLRRHRWGGADTHLPVYDAIRARRVYQRQRRTQVPANDWPTLVTLWILATMVIALTSLL